MTIKRRILLLIGLALAGTVLVMAIGVQQLSSSIETDVADQSKTVVDSATSIVGHFAREAHEGRMSDGDAQKRAAEVISSFRFDGANYVFIVNTDVQMVVHPVRTELVGHDVSQLQDGDGKHFYADMVALAKDSESGFVNYKLVDPKTQESKAKISFVRLFGPWHWVIGSGVFTATAHARVFDSAKWLGAFALLAGAAVLGLGTMIGRSIVNPIDLLAQRMSALSAGNLDAEIPYLNSPGAIGRISAALLQFRDAAFTKLRLEQDAVKARDESSSQRDLVDREKAVSSGHIDSAISALASGLQELAKGNLMHRIASPLDGHLDRLRTDFNNSMIELQKTIGDLGTSGTSIETGSKEIAHAAEELSRRTETQAASLEETAAALDSITDSVKKTASDTNHVRDVVAAARSDAEGSGTISSDAIDAMSAISSSSQKIAQIIGVIDEIAFQTNLLALNAGVEAARAGEAGRGFAVVASEVRALAQRSAEAAKEIKALILTSSSHVEHGADLVRQTGQALVRIVQRVSEIDEIVHEIAASAKSQATGVQEVNIAVTQMDQMTQQNAAMVEESTAACLAMLQESQHLAQLLERFRVGRSEDGNGSGVQRAARSYRSAA